MNDNVSTPTAVQGAATQRNTKRKKVVADLKHLCDYVQSVGGCPGSC